MQKDGTQSWIANNRSVNNLPEENQQPTHNDEVALGAGKPVATKTRRTIHIFIFIVD